MCLDYNFNIKKNKHEDICFLIKELANEDDKYIVGNITFDEAPKFGCNEKLKNKYNGYFYINYFDNREKHSEE